MDMNKARQGAADAVDPRLFRRVMGSFTTGVTVITARDRSGFRGMTANAFMSGSLEPPLCVISIAERAQMHALLLSSDRFGVSILAGNQEDCSIHFAGYPMPGFTPEMDECAGVPVVRGACARLSAVIAARHPCGDHTLFIGSIARMEGDDRPPLVYHSGRYVSLLRHPTDHHIPAPEFW